MAKGVKHTRFTELVKYYRTRVAPDDSGRPTRYTQAKLAELVGVSVHYLSMLERGKRPPTTELAMRIADVLARTPDERTELVAAARGLPHRASTAPSPVQPPITPPVPPPPVLHAPKASSTTRKKAGM